MSGSIFGKIFRIATWGESHGRAIGVVIDGCPAGIAISEDDIQKDMDRRKPGSNKFGTRRKEQDKIEIMSGVFAGKTTGTPISLILYNNDQRSDDYGDIAGYYRPGHADYTYDMKYGFRDYRGGGRSSGRETSARVAAGAIAKKILTEIGVNILTYTVAIGEIDIDKNNFDVKEINNNPLYIPDKDAYIKAEQYLNKLISDNDSAGGVIECSVTGMFPGLGEPVFDKLDAELAKASLSIGGSKGIEFGRGFSVSKLKGSENNDGFLIENDKIVKATNNSGGMLGGISDSGDIIFRIPFKPTASIAKTQKTVNKSNEIIEINISGRHDPVIVPRAVVVVEAMTALTLVDLLLLNMSSKIENIKKLYLSN